MNGFTKHELQYSLQEYIEDAKHYKELGNLAPDDLKYRMDYSLYSILFYVGPPKNKNLSKIDQVFNDLKNYKITDAEEAINKLIAAGLPIENILEETEQER